MLNNQCSVARSFWLMSSGYQSVHDDSNINVIVVVVGVVSVVVAVVGVAAVVVVVLMVAVQVGGLCSVVSAWRCLVKIDLSYVCLLLSTRGSFLLFSIW